MGDLYKVSFPKHLTVTGKPGVALPGPVVLEDVNLPKALAYARSASATVTDDDGNKVASPEVVLTDGRPEPAAALAKEHAGQIAELQETVARLQSELAKKANRPGPKAGRSK